MRRYLNEVSSPLVRHASSSVNCNQISRYNVISSRQIATFWTKKVKKNSLNSRMLRFSLFMLFLVVAVQYGNCENNTDCDNVTSKPGTDTPRLSIVDKVLEILEEGEKAVNKTVNKAKKRFDEIFGRKSSNRTSRKYNNELSIIFPGTRWCGNGDNAKNEADLGLFNKTDACCRAHDNCQNDLVAGETEVNLNNTGLYTRSACTCDFAFYNCLKNVSSLIAHSIGDTYFNILRPQCFQCECPTPDCNLNDDTECKGHCKKYKWVDNPRF